MFGMGMGELLLIMVVALLVVGPDKLPQAAKAIGKGIRDFRRHTQELQTTLEQDENLGEAVRELRSALRDDPFRAVRTGLRQPVTPASGEAGSVTEPPSIVPAAGAVAKESIERTGDAALPSPASPAPPSVEPRPDPRPGTTPSSRADDPAHG